jgi:AcrR family transcriptional regulator
MDLAEAHIRNRGYGGFSFRELAAEIGIKSASVHHHFPTKATMAAAVARRYADRFLAAVAGLPNERAEDAIAAYRSAFREALDRDGQMCLCGVLGAEAGALSPDVATEVLSFFLPPLHRRPVAQDWRSRRGSAGVPRHGHAGTRFNARPCLRAHRGIRSGGRRAHPTRASRRSRRNLGNAGQRAVAPSKRLGRKQNERRV